MQGRVVDEGAVATIEEILEDGAVATFPTPRGVDVRPIPDGGTAFPGCSWGRLEIAPPSRLIE